MLNQVVLVGRLADDIILEKENEKNLAKLIISIVRTEKNEKGINECDLIPCVFYVGTAVSINKHCHKGDLIGIKGKLQIIDSKVTVIAEKVTFLSRKNMEE